MNEIKIINQLSIDKKGKKTLYQLPTIEQYLINNKILKDHLDWPRILDALDRRYETIDDHNDDLAALREELTPEGLGYTLNLDSNQDLVYNQGKTDEETFLNKDNLEDYIQEALESFIPDLSDYATKAELNDVAGDLSALATTEGNHYNALNSKFGDYALVGHNHSWNNLDGVNVLNSGYLELTRGTNLPTKYVELLDSTDKLTAVANPTNCHAFVTEYNGKILLVAEADTNYQFRDWTSGSTFLSSNSTHIITKTSSTPSNFSANFIPKQQEETTYTLNFTADSNGFVSITNPITGEPLTSYTVPSGTNITITATPKTGYKFDHWESQDLSEELINVNPIENYGVVGPIQAKAIFIAKTVYHYNVAAPGFEVSNPSAYIVSSIGRNLEVTEGESFSLTVRTQDPDDYRFVKWTSDYEELTEGVRSFTNNSAGSDAMPHLNLNGVTNFNAVYLKFYEVNNTVKDVAGNTLNGATITIALVPGTGELKQNGNKTLYSKGSDLTLTAQETITQGNVTYKFVKWHSDNSTSLTRSVEDLAGNITDYPVYGRAYAVTCVAIDEDEGEAAPQLGKVTLQGGANIPAYVIEGTHLQLVPVVLDSNYTFGYWNYDPYDNIVPLDVEVTEDITIYAVFKHIRYLVKFIKPTSSQGTLEVNGNTLYGNSLYINKGDTVTLTLTQTTSQAEAYVFNGWSTNNGETTIENSNAKQENVYTYVTAPITEEVTYSPVFEGMYLVQASINPSQAGTLVANSTKYVAPGSSHTVGVSLYSAYAFDGWYEGDVLKSTNTSYQFTVTSNITLVAKAHLKEYNVTITINPSGAGTVTDSDGNPIGNTVVHGSALTLKATPNSGYTFSHWNSDTTDTIATKTIRNITEDVSVTANFALEQFTVNVVADPTTGGTVYIGNNSTQTSLSVNQGDTPTLHANAASGYVFSGWKKDNGSIISDSNTASYTVTTGITANTTFTAVFTKQYTINVNVPSAQASIGTATIISGETTPTSSAGSSVTINSGSKCTAKAFVNDDAYTFSNWTNNKDNKTSTSNPLVITASRDVTYTANFQEIPITPQYYYYMSTNRTDINPSIANSTALNLDQVVSVSAQRALVFLIPNSASNIKIQQQILNGFEDITDTFISDSTSVDGYVKYYIQGTVDPLTGAGTYLNGDYKLVQGS